jgi:2-polyprenyl-6-methoxyphenol hydroxylase-like FAD-dependent oxidoreductase
VADGIQSAIRAQIHGKSAPRYAGYVVFQGTVDFKHELVPLGTFRVLWGCGTRFAFYHITDSRLYWTCVIKTAPGGTEVDKQALLDRVNGWMGPTQEIIASTDLSAIRRADHCDRPPLEWWGARRVTLVGDAAHPTTFNVGQGACLAIEDSLVLANSLIGQSDVSAALQTYEELRKGRTAAIQTRAWRLGTFNRLSNPVACFARNQLLAITLRTAGLRSQRAEMSYVV